MTFIRTIAGQEPGQREWRCWHIHNAGGRGESVYVHTPHYAKPVEAARLAASALDERDKARVWLRDSDFHGDMRVIEVEGAGRFRVVCKVVRTYEAREA